MMHIARTILLLALAAFIPVLPAGVIRASQEEAVRAVHSLTDIEVSFKEALQLMKEGAKWMLYIPSNLAYGECGAGRDIGPNQTLIFEVELISIADTSR